MTPKAAYLAGQLVGSGMAKQAMDPQLISMLSMLGGGALGAAGGAASAEKDEKTGNRSQLSMLLRALLFGGAGALAGGAGPGLVGALSKGDFGGIPGMMGESLGSAVGGLKNLGSDLKGALSGVADDATKGYDRGLKG